jgi:glyoxylase-like metal-dependent hydrolase (beta-lactamase superfamily II)
MNVRRVLAPNPGPYTGEGTNSYVLDSGGDVVVIDPGPRVSRHMEAIMSVIGDLRPRMVLVTHTHSDHAPGANPLARELHVPAAGFGPGDGFKPDRTLADNDIMRFGGDVLHVVATPGHSPDHLCYLVGRALFTGDHIMGGSSVFVEDMTSYLGSLRRLQHLDLDTLYPGHGPTMNDPQAVIAGYLDHRLERERQILGAARSGAVTVGAIVDAVYANVDPTLHPLAAVAVRAHLRKLDDDGLLTVDGDRVVVR